MLDLAMYLGTGGITRRGLHDIHEQLKTMADTMKKWTDWSGGLRVVDREEVELRNAEFERELAEEEAARAAESETEEDAQQ